MADLQQGPSRAVKNSELFSEWLKAKNMRRPKLLWHLKQFVLSKEDVNESLLEEALLKFIKNVEVRWKKSSRNKEYFKSVNCVWLDTELKILYHSYSDIPSTSKIAGRPLKKFEECGVRGKQIRTRKLVDDRSVEELSFATQTSLRKCGKRTAAAVLYDVTSTSPTRAKNYKRAYNNWNKEDTRPIKYTEEEALALIINAKLSKQQYLLIRAEAQSHNVTIYPSWNKILKAKKNCLPEPEFILITEQSAEVKLQTILDLTTQRICYQQAPVLQGLPNEKKTFTMICKWGCDGSSGQSNYKQRFSDESQDDSSVFVVSFVPLQLHCTISSNDEQIIVWKNSAPSSTRFCRAIKFIFTKESQAVIERETLLVQKQINEISPTTISESILINYELVLTMVDGKICNSLANNRSTQMCYICHAKPTEMNDLDRICAKTPITQHYKFGLSPLHSWIRFLECCLHIAYRLDIKTYQARGPHKLLVQTKKKEIVDKLRQQLGILVDQPKPGYGSTNDGNTARTFFRDPKLTSAITGLNENLIRRFSVILQALSSGYKINPGKFDKYAKDTAALFVREYKWYYMPPSVHKVLIHGSEVIKHVILPIGQLGEEAQEAKNKDFKFIREHHTRKNSRVSTNEDLMNYLFISSDPIISHIARNRKLNHRKPIDVEVLNLLDEPDTVLRNEQSNSSDSDD